MDFTEEQLQQFVRFRDAMKKSRAIGRPGALNPNFAALHGLSAEELRFVVLHRQRLEELARAAGLLV